MQASNFFLEVKRAHAMEGEAKKEDGQGEGGGGVGGGGEPNTRCKGCQLPISHQNWLKSISADSLHSDLLTCVVRWMIRCLIN